MKPKNLKKKLNLKKVTIARLDQGVIKAGASDITNLLGCVSDVTCTLTCVDTCETCAETCEGRTCGPLCNPTLPPMPTCSPC